MGFDAFGLLMVDRAQLEVALGGAEGGFGLGELDVPTPQFGRVGFSTVGSQ